MDCPCPICLAAPQEPLVMPCCKKAYCNKCITQWHQVKNSCPMCCSISGEKLINTLSAQPHQEFDNGFMMLETEVKELLERAIQVQNRISSKRSQFKNYKTSVPASLMQYLEKQSLKIESFSALMEENFLLHNRGSTVEYTQLLAELILQVEYSLEINQAVEEDYDGYDEEGYDDYEEYDDEYYDYADYEEQARGGSSKKLNISLNTKNKKSSQTQIIK